MIGRLQPNPILIHELRAVLRTRRFFSAFWISLLLLALATVSALAVQPSSARELPPDLGWRTFLLLLVLQAHLILIVYPAFSCGAIVGERDRRTLDLLLVTSLTPSRIVMGKLQASCSYLLLYLTATLPLAGIATLYGGVQISEILVGYLLLALLGVLVNLLALFFSAVSSTSSRAIAATYGIVVLVVMLGSGPSGEALHHPARVRHLLLIELAEVRRYSYLFLGGVSYIAIAGLSYLATLNRLRPPSANKSTPLRVFHLALIISMPVVLMNVHMLYQPPHPELQLRAACVAMWIAAAYALGLIACFSTEERVPHPRVSQQIGELTPILKTFRSWLYPGGYSGPTYAILMTVLLLGMVHLFVATEYAFLSMKPPPGWQPPATAWPAFTLGLGAYLLATGALGHFLCAFSIQRRTRIGIILTFVMLTLLAPYVLRTIGNPDSWLRPLSPLLTAQADWTQVKPDSPAQRLYEMRLGPESSMRISDVGRLFYILLAALFVCLSPLKLWGRIGAEAEED